MADTPTFTNAGMASTFRFTTPASEYVGGYRLGGPDGLRVNLKQRPSAWRRFWMRACLNWIWEDDA